MSTSTYPVGVTFPDAAGPVGDAAHRPLLNALMDMVTRYGPRM